MRKVSRRRLASTVVDLLRQFPLEDSARSELTRYLQYATGAKTVELNEQVEEELLAGTIVRTATEELDTSARSRLNQLRGLK